MHIVKRAEIHFHEQETASVFLESNVSGNVEKFGEIALVVAYAIRTMSNLGPSEPSQGLAGIMAACSETIRAIASDETTGGLTKLIPYPGHPGRKRFYLNLLLTDTGMKFDVKYRGLGLLSTGIAYYGPISVVALLRYVAKKRVDDSERVNRFETTPRRI